ncbi:glycosyltransferase [Desulfatiglans anilini]|uniref:glycosyltransferase n=1 Tax=Desulfatiglans anilini TaxID=90728 RepID=UPI000684021C|nr:glycosyltransferase [Desulfatiglans anilini]
MKVSVIMPVYNRERYVCQAIESVLQQIYKDFELIVIDDGSTDRSADLIASFSDSRLHYLRQRHSGISAAMNHGLQVASGQYIARLDSDDVWLPQMLASQVAILEKETDIGVVYAKAQQIDETGNRMREVRGKAMHFTGDSLKSILFEDFTCNITVVARRGCFALAGRYDTSLYGNEDWDMWLRIAKHCKFKFNDQILAFFRSHSGNITKNTSPFFDKILETRIHVLDKAFADSGISIKYINLKPTAYSNVYISVGCHLLVASKYNKALSAFINSLNANAFSPKILIRIIFLVFTICTKKCFNQFYYGIRFMKWQSSVRGKIRTY